MQERRTRSNVWKTAALTAVLCVVLVPLTAHAVDVISSCDAVCDVNCELGTSLVCCANSNICPDGAGPITLNNGKNLDLKGESIECFCGTLTCNGGTNNNDLCLVNSDCDSNLCENQTGCTACNEAVIMNANSSWVKNTGSAESQIFGPWSPAIDCKSKSSTRVQSIKFVGLADDGVVNCAQVDRNVFQTGGGTAIITSGIANGDVITDNHVDDFVTGIAVTGSKGVSVDHNLVSLRRSDATGVAGIDVSAATSSGLDVNDNVIMGVGTVPIDESSSGSFSANFCNPLNAECAGCAWCETPTPPFSLP